MITRILSLLFLVFLFLLQLNVQAQRSPIPKNSVQARDYFVRMQQQSLRNILLAAEGKRLQEEMNIAAVREKNVRMLEAGNMDDSMHKGFNNRLQLLTDSNAAGATTYQSLLDQVNDISILRRKYSQLNNQVFAFQSALSSGTGVRNGLLETISVDIDSANLSGEKKKLRTILQNAAAQTAKEGVILEKMGNNKKEVVAAGNLDSTTSTSLDNRLALYQQRLDSMKQATTELSSQLESPQAVRKDFKLIRSKILLIDSIVNKNAVAREFVFTMISDGLRSARPQLYSLAAFFGPGGYRIPPAKFALAEKYFAPVVDSLIHFSNRYNNVVRIGSVVVNGYADASNISPGTRLYDTLTAYLNQPQAARENLNAGLSALRAEEIARFVNALLRKRLTEFQSPDKIVFESLEVGMGEQFPNPNIRNYKANDERRRIAKIYWSVLPAQ